MKKLLLWCIRCYQKHISPHKRYATCKYHPTCSAYAYEAIETRGVFVGSCLAIWRILRCNPFSRGGYDPVPKRK